MAVAFNLLNCWIWGGKGQESPDPSLSSSESGMGFRELDYLTFASVNGRQIRSNSRRVKKKWNSREQRRIDKEYDVVVVPSDGGCMSGSESDDSDWSIGWLEPHAPEFQNENKAENSFAVLVPCYGRGRSENVDSSEKHGLGAAHLMDNDYSDAHKYIEQWLAEQLPA